MFTRGKKLNLFTAGGRRTAETRRRSVQRIGLWRPGVSTISLVHVFVHLRYVQMDLRESMGLSSYISTGS